MKFIIVAGTNKSGTTSLFNYLAGHPTVTSSSMKQTDFFLQENVIFEDYLSFFSREETNSLSLMEASPDYLYNSDAPIKIQECLRGHDVSLVFLLRKPEDRLLSWFKYSKQLFLIPQDMTFSKLGINADFYSSYNFEIFNKSQNSRNKSLRTFYLFLRNLFLPLAKSNFKFLSKIVYKIGKAVSGLYRKINLTKKAVDVNIQDADSALISDYYKRSNEKLSALIGEKLPWNTGK